MPPHTRRALVLNSAFQPLCTTTAARALDLVASGRAEMVETSGVTLRSERLEHHVPSVIRIRRFVNVSWRTPVHPTRRAVFRRDRGLCGYCGAPGDTLDHIVPISRGGAHEWANLTVACRPCNYRKADRTPEEAGMCLLHPTLVPAAHTAWMLHLNTPHPTWETWLPARAG